MGAVQGMVIETGELVETMTAVPVSVGTANAEGTSPKAAKADHVHNHDNQAGGALHAVASSVAAGFMAAADFVRLYGTVAAATSVPTGAGYTTLQTTAAVLAANNTSRSVSFSVTHNRALASLITASGTAAFMVARLNDGTQTIQSLETGFAVTAAAPVITGTLVTGVGWQATLNANGTVTFDLARNAGFNRSATCRYWAGDLVTQVAP